MSSRREPPEDPQQFHRLSMRAAPIRSRHIAMSSAARLTRQQAINIYVNGFELVQDVVELVSASA